MIADPMMALATTAVVLTTTGVTTQSSSVFNMSLGSSLTACVTILGVISAILGLVKIRYDYTLQLKNCITPPQVQPSNSNGNGSNLITYKQANEEFVRKESFDLVVKGFDKSIDEFKSEQHSIKVELENYRKTQQQMLNKINQLIIVLSERGLPVGKRRSDYVQDSNKSDLLDFLDDGNEK